MQCRNCGFVVPQNLKFAIMKNFCPQCGNKIFTEEEMNNISMLQSRISSQRFSSAMTEEIIYDVALYIYNEFTNGYGRVLIEKEIKKLSLSGIVASDETATTLKPAVVVGQPNEDLFEEDYSEDDYPDYNDGALSSLEEDEDFVKKSIREEEAARVLSTGATDVDLDEKVKRLKDLHKNTKLKVKNPMIRRIE